jgi:serine/threonine-protein kinase
MSDVFVSYKAEDRSRVAPLVAALEADGHSVWWDAHIAGGEEWRDEIADQLEAASCVIVVWSKRSIGKEGRFVRDEATRALKSGTYLPIRIDRIEPPLGFGETQALPLLGWKGDRNDPQFAAIEEAVSAKLRKERTVRPVPAGVSRRKVVVGGAVALVAAGTGGWLLLKPGSAEANSIAVLPFANLSGDPAQSYFSDGIAEELRSALSRIAGLKVVARTSSEMLRESDAKTAADKLGVENIVSGSVRRSPSMIRVNAQLVDGSNGLERWSETFDRPAGDVLTIQSEIAESVARALSIELASADKEALTIGGTRNAQAQDLLLRAEETRRRDDSEASFRSALSLLDQAIALDPSYAQAHARKAFVLTYLASVHALSAEQARREGELASQSARRAIDIAPRLAMAHASLANVLRDQLQMGEALRESKSAFALGGVDALTLNNYTMLLSQSGQAEEAQAMARRTVEVDPLNPVSFEVQAVVLYYSRRYQGAVAAARRSLQMAPDRVRPRAFIAHSLLALGQSAPAMNEYARIPAGDYRRLLGEAVLAARSGRRADAEKSLASMQQRYGDAANYQYGQIYSQLGLVDRAFEAFDAAWAVRDAGLGYLRVDPFIEPLRKDPRFAAIEAKLNFPQS